VVGSAGDQAGAERFDEGAKAEGLVRLWQRLFAAMLMMGVLGFRVVRHGLSNRRDNESGEGPVPSADPARGSRQRQDGRPSRRAKRVAMTNQAITVFTPGSSTRRRAPKPRASKVARRSWALCLKCAHPSV